MQAGQPIDFTTATSANRKIENLETIETIDAALTIGGQSLNLNSTQDATFTGPKLVINGNVDIQGTLNSISSTQVTFDDSTILLNSNKPNTETASNSDPDAGFEVNRGANTNVSFLWNETNDNWLLTGGPLNMGGSLKITGLATPTAATDAATMGYVDDANTAMTTFVTDSIATANSAMTIYVDNAVAGATMADSDILSGLLNVDGTGSTLDADLLDGLEADVFMKHDGTAAMTGALDMGNNDISNANNVVATNMLIGTNQVLHAGNLPITANTVDGDTVYTFAALA